MLRKGLLIMLVISMLASAVCGCGAPAAEDGTTAATQTPEPTTEPTEPTEPDDGSIRFYYDDRISFGELGGNDASSVQILEQQATSFQVGTQTPDEAVLYYDEANRQFIAVGVGTATLEVDGAQVAVRVRPAPISLFMITGHSIGAGQCGVAAQSVAIEPGQAYSCHKTSTFQSATLNTGLGCFAAEKPTGIDAFSAGGGGTIGEGSGIAWKWNQLTGEKVWVLNAGVGGSVISEWHKGQPNYTAAVAMYRAAALVIRNEVAAGHYKLKNTAIIYHSNANFGYKNVEFNDEIMEFWYDSMIGGFREDLAMDITGDGEKETVQAFGLLPHWSHNTPGKYPNDTPIDFYLALSDAYPGCFIVGETMRNWCSDSLLKENFPAIEYSTQSEPVIMPAVKDELKAADGTHFSQVAYNAAGLEIGENLYNYFRTKTKAEQLVIYNANGMKVKDSLELKRVGATVSLIVEAEPYYVSDFTIELSDNLELSSPFTVKAVASGEGYITISRDGQVFQKITVTVK